MNKIFTKNLFFLAIFIVFGFGSTLAQTITIGAVDPGPYGQGATIAVPFVVSGGSCIGKSNSFNLYLSDAGGGFAAPTLIGTINDFYATFINGVIPNGTPAGAGYKVMVKSTQPAVSSTISAAFSINSSAGVIAGVNSSTISPNFPEVFGACNGKDGTLYAFVNTSSPGAAVAATFFNELSQASEGTQVLNPSANFTAKASSYTVYIKATVGGAVGTKGYILINNSVNNSFGATGSTTTCLGSGTGLSYNVDVTSTNGIQNNYPGLLYNISWGDGKSDTLSLCDIVAGGGIISHIYKKTSCGNSVNGQNNSFEVDLQPSNKFCGNVGTKVTSYAKVSASPINSFTSPLAGCVNGTTTFTNTSFPGEDPTNTTANCINAQANYTWLVDGNTIAVNYTATQQFSYIFPTPGMHSVTLHLQSNGTLCSDTDVTHNICIQNPPQVKFALPGNKFCAPVKITPTNQTILDLNCNSVFQYTWFVSGPAPVGYANGTTRNSTQPDFIFSNAGQYYITLSVGTASCGVSFTTAQTIVVDSISVAKLSKDTILCGNNQKLTFSPTATATKTLLNGTTQSGAAPFKWVITGGNYAFVNGSSDTSQYPTINFTDLVQYTINVTNTNSCGNPSSDTQHITFQQSPIISAGADTLICSNSQAKLNGSIKGGAYNSVKWGGGNGTFSNNASLKPTYTPTAAEIKARIVTLTLTASTSLVPPCNTISSSVTINIAPPDTVTSNRADTICSGVTVNHKLTASSPGSTYTWAIDAKNTSKTVSGYTASGSDSTISVTVTNSDPQNYGVAAYIITVTSKLGCNYTYPYAIVVSPTKSVAKFTSDVTSGCDSLKVKFTNQSIPSYSAFVWDFGDGSPPDNTANPSHIFIPRTDGKDTVYTVTLNASSNCGASSPFTSKITVSPHTPVSFISPQQIVGCSPFTLAVNNFSPGNNKSYTYYLYDDTTLVQKIDAVDKSQVRFNPITTTITKQFSLYMDATNLCGVTGRSNIIPITISATNIIAQTFIENGTNKGCIPLTINLINNSLGGDTYYYTIYDVNHVVLDRRQGGAAPLPYTFKEPGIFYITITASNSCSTVESSPAVRVDVYPAPLPDFSADVTSGCKNVAVKFTNLTPDDPNTQASALLYDWDFGDGTPHSFVYSPKPHVYNYRNSPFTVTLTATNLVTNCVNVVSKTKFINITAPPATAFITKPAIGVKQDTVTSIPNYRFLFYDETPDLPQSWIWNFGDGQSATSQNPGHTYADTGVYKVSLTAASGPGCDSTIFHYVKIGGVPGQLFLPNAFEPGSGTLELKYFTAKGSGIKEWHMQIFNNFSQLVWETTKLDAKGAPVDGWDGTFNGQPAPQGVYVWQVSATFINGSEWKGNVLKNSLPKRTGVVHLIR